MDQIAAFLQSYLPAGISLTSVLQALLVLVIGVIAIGALARVLFGQDSLLNRSISTAIGILFIYVITICVHSFGVNLSFLMSPLPFVELKGESLAIFSFLESDFPNICYQILSMVILAFLANLTDQWLNIGRTFFTWLLFRCLSVVLAMVLHLLAHMAIANFVPEGLFQWAPAVLLGVLAAMLLTGSLKIVAGVAIGTVNPIIGALYTFFFANIIGTMISKAALTAAILSAMILVLNYYGITSVLVTPAALIGYIPFLLVLLAIWYVIGHIFADNKKKVEKD